MYRLRAMFRKCGQSAPILAPIAVISGHYWRQRNGGQNETKEWTITRLWPEFALRNAGCVDWIDSVFIVSNRSQDEEYGSGFVVDDRGYVVTAALGVGCVTDVALSLALGRPTHELFADKPIDPNQLTYDLNGRVVYADPTVGLALIKVSGVKRGALQPLDIMVDEKLVAGQTVAVLGASTGKYGCGYIFGTITCLEGPPVGANRGNRVEGRLVLNPNHQYIGHNILSPNTFNGGPVITGDNDRVVGVMLCARTGGQHILPVKDLRAFIQKGLDYEPKDRKNRYSFEGKSRLGVVLKCDVNGFEVLKFTDNNKNTALQVGDQITHINGKDFKKLSQLIDTLNIGSAVQTIELTVVRAGGVKQVSVTSQPLEYSIV